MKAKIGKRGYQTSRMNCLLHVNIRKQMRPSRARNFPGTVQLKAFEILKPAMSLVSRVEISIDSLALRFREIYRKKAIFQICERQLQWCTNNWTPKNSQVI